MLGDSNQKPSAGSGKLLKSEVIIARGFYICHHKKDDKFYCLRLKQSVYDRIDDLSRHQVKPDIAESQNSSQF